jgi:mRNA-degrading endonuclease RelE of RelBE toxin-antitoxin system
LEMEERHRHALEQDDPGNDHCTTFKAVDDAIRRLIPADPMNKKYALHKPLDGFYRIAKGRLRILWAVEPDLREILIVFISDTPRKEGDTKDPYVIWNAMAKAGYLQEIVDDWRKVLAVPPDAPIN